MTERVSRRTLLGIAAVGTAAVAAGASLQLRGCRNARPRDAATPASLADYVDRNGWILTPADGEALGGGEREVGR